MRGWRLGLNLLSELHVLVAELVWRVLVGLGHVTWMLVGSVHYYLNRVPLGEVPFAFGWSLVEAVSVACFV